MPRSITLPLLKWFDQHQRPMPWRASRDAYRIWVSEVMLQQTTVAAVIPYFERFMLAFPTVEALAAAPLQDVLSHWQGLGYYRRARHLHAAAGIIVAEHAGKFPDDVEAAAALPGVGLYIRGAVLSQAYERREPIVEANTIRLLARLFAYRGDPRVGDGLAWAWQMAASLLPSKRIGDFNQALMELGSQVCTPVVPRCEACPIRKHCKSFELGLQAEIPVAKAKKTILAVNEITVVIRHRDEFLLVQCPDDAPRWAGMWEFPRAAGTIDDAAAIAKRLTGLTVHIGTEIVTHQHTVTRHRIRLTALLATARSRTLKLQGYQAARWLPLEQIAVPMSTPQRHVLAALRQPQRKLF